MTSFEQVSRGSEQLLALSEKLASPGWSVLEKAFKKKKKNHLISFLILKFEKKLQDYPKRSEIFN